MSNDRLSPFSFTVLALVGEAGASPHDIVRMMRRGRVYWTTSESHYYAEPKRLARLGYLDAETVAGRTRQRTYYRLTEAGREALRCWIREPTPLPRIQEEAAVRLLAADIAGDDTAVAASLASMRAELDALAAGIDEAEVVASTFPHRERYLRLVHELGRALVAVHRTWLDAVERELGPGTSAGAGETPPGAPARHRGSPS